MSKIRTNERKSFAIIQFVFVSEFINTFGASDKE